MNYSDEYNDYEKKEIQDELRERATGARKKAVNQKGRQAARTGIKLLGKGVKALGKAVFVAIKALLPYAAIIAAVLLLVITSYYVIFEFIGTEKQYTKRYTNQITYDADGRPVVSEKDMNSQNKIIRDFYKFFSGQSFYKILGDDLATILTPDEAKEVKDYYKRENTFKLNPNLLYSLDEYIYKGNWKYPEQMIKPVNYDEEELVLLPLVDEEGNVIVESDEEDIETGEKTGNKILSVRDYGLGSIFVYNVTEDWIKTRKLKGTYVKKDVWDESSKSVITIDIEEEFDIEVEVEEIDLIEKVIAFIGTIEYEYEYKDERVMDLTPGITSDEKQARTEYIYDVYHEPIYEEYEDEDGKIKERIVDYREHRLKKYRSEDSAVFDNIPVVVNTEVDDVEMEYFEAFLAFFESYIPLTTINDFEFSDRIDYDSYVFDLENILSDDYGFGMGSGRESSPAKFERGFQWYNIAEKHSEEFGVDPFIITAIITQESGGNPYINADGLAQITDAAGTTVSATNIYGEYVTHTVEKDERQDPDKAIRYLVIKFHNLLKTYNGNPYKAIQAWNLGEQTMSDIRRHTENAGSDWDNGFDWLLYRELGRQDQAPTGYRSANYSCMTFVGGEATGSGVWGNSCYLEMVLQWYVGHEIDEIDIGNVSPGFFGNIKDNIKNLFKKFIHENEEDNEDEEPGKANFIHHVRYDKISDVLKTTYALDNSSLFSESREGYNDLNFWDKGFMASLASVGLSLEELLEIAPNADGYTPPIVLSPERGVVITSLFNPNRLHPKLGIIRPHTGVDIGAPIGEPVFAIADGKVVTAGNFSSAGNMIVIDHGDGVTTRYLHLSGFEVDVGDVVRQKDIVGYVGNTGLSTGPHLHFEFIKDGVYLDPIGIVQEE